MASNVPSTMRGVRVDETGGVEVLKYLTDLPVPSPQAGQILVKNEYIGINYIDTYFRTGLYPAPKPEILGREASGTVVSVGSDVPAATAETLKPGTRVVWMGTGAYAEYTATPADKVVPIPSEVDDVTAAAALLQGLTALTLIRESHFVQKGDTVLVHAAAGGTGLWLCQLLAAVGANTIATASTPEKLALAKANGATHLINYSKEDVVQRVKEITNGVGAVAIFDGVGKATFDTSLECVARKGTLVTFGNASGAVPPVTISRLTAKNTKLLRPTMVHYLTTPEEFKHYVDELWKFIVQDKINVKVHEIYPLKDVARAQTDLEGRKTTGKLLLKP